MIIQRYLIRQVASSTLAIVALLCLIVAGGRLIRYFGLAAAGGMDVAVVLSVVGFRLLDFITIILPLGFFIALMLTFGRLYVDHEMAVLNASGVSRNQVGWMLWPLLVAVMVLEAALALYVAPWGNERSSQLLAEQATRGGFEVVQPATFVTRGKYTFYADDRTPDGRGLKGIFVYQHDPKNGRETIVTAARAERRMDPQSHSSVIDLYNGQRTVVAPNTFAHSRAGFDFYRLYLNDQEQAPEEEKATAQRTAQLVGELNQKPAQGELGWRLAMPWTPLLALILAIPLAQVNPRQGRYLRLFPAILLFMSLLIALLAVRTQMSKDKGSAWSYLYILLSYTGLAAWLNRPRRR